MNKDIRIKLERLRERLWWFDVVYPITLILFLFGSLTYIIYVGEPQYRLSKIAEKRLLINSLKLAGNKPIKNPGKVLIVSASPFEVNTLGRAPSGSIPDVNAGAYARVLQKLLAAGTRSIFVNWDTEAHLFDEIYMMPLTETLRPYGKSNRIFFGMNPDHMELMPIDFAKVANFLDSGPCDEVIEFQVECVYNKKWDDWVVQAILNELGESGRKESETPPWISLELSSSSPRYILNLSRPETIDSMTFSELLAAGPETLTSYQVAFIGVDYRHVLSPAANHTFPLMVRTVYDPERTAPIFSGTPSHEFWAQIAQMYIDRDMISVPSSTLIRIVTVSFCLLILIVMIFFGDLHALGMFVAFVILAPIVNASSLRMLQLYIPMFDCYFFGVTILISTGMLRLSWSSWQRWQLATRRRYHSKFMDLKSNFISLFSHNLNTPVAKMQGMLGILKTSLASSTEDSLRLAQEADTYVGLLEYTIRGVLVGSALEEQSLNEAARPLRNLYVDVLESNASSLRRLGVNITPKLLHALDDDALLTPIVVDVRALSATLSSVAALFRSPSQTAAVAITMRLLEDDTGQILEVHYRSKNSSISQQAIETFRNPENRQSMKRLQGDKFIDEILAGLGILFVSHYQGQIVQNPINTEGYEIRLTFRADPNGDGKAIA